MADSIRTKTVSSYFGDKQVTREEYVKQWTSHFGQLFHLAMTTREFDELEVMKIRIVEMAGNRWDQLK